MVVSITLTVMQGHSGSAEEHIQLWIISTTNLQAIKIKLAATVGHDKFYFSLKSASSTRRLELWSHERLM